MNPISKFQLVVIVALVLGRRLPQHDRFAHSLKAAVHEKGATLVLFCFERMDAIYGGLFH